MRALTLLSSLVAAGFAPAQLQVATVAPPRHALAAPAATAVSITFTAAVDPATVTPATLRVFGRWSGVMGGTLSFANGNRTVTFRPSRPFFPGETVTVAASARVSGPAGNLARGHAWSFWVRPAPAAPPSGAPRRCRCAARGKG